MVIGAIPVSAGIQPNANATNSAYAQKILEMADNAKLKVEALLGSVMSNATLMSNQTVNDTVNSIIDNDTGLLKMVKELLQDAHNNFTQGNYTEATNLSLNAMQIFREIYAELVQITGEAEDNLQGQGLLVAMNCALERLQKMNNSLSNLTINIQTARNYLKEAEGLLNTTEARFLLQQGNVSAVAHRIAEANRLMNQATQALKITAQERIQARVDQYLQKLERNRERIMERLNATDINATELFAEFGFKNMGEFNQAMISLKNMVQNHMGFGQFNKAMGVLNSMANLTQSFSLKLQKRLILFPTPLLPPQPQGEPGLQVTAKKISVGSTLTLEVTINNTGNATIVFPNSAYGVTVDKKVSDEDWYLYYTPISAQVLVSLKPGEIDKMNILLSGDQYQGLQGLGKMKGNKIQAVSIPSGTYRVTVHGWVEGTYAPITASAEFTVP